MKPMLKSLLVIATLFCCLFFVSRCTKVKVQNTPIDSDMESHFNYKVGSYWIYKDSISGQVDSFVVYGNNQIKQKKDDQHTYDEIDVYINEFNVGANNPTHSWCWALLDNHIEFTENITINMSTYHIGVDYECFLKWPIYVGDQQGRDRDVFSVVENYPQLTVLGSQYTNIWQLFHSTVGNELDDWFWISTDKGIIKMVLDRYGQQKIVWELQRSMINL